MKLPEELQFIENARKPQKTTADRMDGKWCIITGATSGVGYQAACCLARGGANLILVCRNTKKADSLKTELVNRFGITVEIVISDFSRLKEVRDAANSILESHSRVDVLINNAGVHYTHRELTAEGFEMVFAVNHLAPFLFTRLLLPYNDHLRSFQDHPGQLAGTPLWRPGSDRPGLEPTEIQRLQSLRCSKNSAIIDHMGVCRPISRDRCDDQRHAPRGSAHEYRHE